MAMSTIEVGPVLTPHSALQVNADLVGQLRRVLRSTTTWDGQFMVGVIGLWWLVDLPPSRFSEALRWPGKIGLEAKRSMNEFVLIASVCPIC